MGILLFTLGALLGAISTDYYTNKKISELTERGLKRKKVYNIMIPDFDLSKRSNEINAIKTLINSENKKLLKNPYFFNCQ